MEEMKVSEDVLKQLNVRKVALNSSQILVQMANRELNLFMIDQIKELGLDGSKAYNIDEKSGVISEVKSEPVKKEENESKES